MYSRKGSGRKNAPSWQDIAEMHVKSANSGKICFLCILKGVKNAVREYISRISCPEGPLFPSGALKSCTMGKLCHSFVIPPSARRGVAHDHRCDSGISERCGPLHLEAQALWVSTAGASSWGPPGGANIMGPTWRRKRCGRPSRGASVVVRSLCGNVRAATKSYRAGKAITNTAPPSGALNAVTVPSKLSTISFTMAKPRPAPPLLRAREASLR